MCFLQLQLLAHFNEFSMSQTSGVIDLNFRSETKYRILGELIF